MAANRLFYSFALGAAIVYFAAADKVWFAWALLFLILLLPVLSLLLSLPQMLSVSLKATGPSEAEQGQDLTLALTPRTVRWLPMPELRLRIRLQMQGSDQFEYRYLRHIPRAGGTVRLEAGEPGLLCCTVTKLRVYDYLGLIWLPKRLPATLKTAVLPIPVQPEPLPDLTAFRTVRLAALPQGSYSEDHDHRPYREGDNVRAIHWKLSQKTDDLIVREPVAPVRLRSFVILDPARTLPDLQSELAQLRWLSGWLSERGLFHTVLWQTDTGTQAREVAQQSDVTPMLAAVCASPIFPETVPPVAIPEADWICRIGPPKEVQP